MMDIGFSENLQSLITDSDSMRIARHIAAHPDKKYGFGIPRTIARPNYARAVSDIRELDHLNSKSIIVGTLSLWRMEKALEEPLLCVVYGVSDRIQTVAAIRFAHFLHNNKFHYFESPTQEERELLGIKARNQSINLELIEEEAPKESWNPFLLYRR